MAPKNNIIVEEEDLVIPPTLSNARMMFNAVTFPLTVLVVFYVFMISRRGKNPMNSRTIWILLISYVLQISVRLTQSILNRSGSPDESISVWDTLREVIYVLTWTMLFLLLSQLIVLITLLTEPDRDEVADEDNYMKTAVTKGEQIRN